MKFNLLAILGLSLMVFACQQEKNPEPPKAEPPATATPQFQNKGHELIYNMTQKVGTYRQLAEKKDVVYTYTYATPDGKTDISTEKYIFDGELSYGMYHQHQRTLADLEGPIEQGYDGTEYWLKQQGQMITDSLALKRVAFNRPTNFYWFTMFQKLLDPGLNYEYLGEKQIQGTAYDIVKVSFDSPADKPTDIYQVYINRETELVDQFLFTVADFGIMDTPSLMEVEYEEVDGILIPTKRRYKRSDWEATVSDQPWISVNWTDIKFNNGLTAMDFKQ